MPGVSNMVRIFPENHSAVIVLTNTDDRTMARETALHAAQVLLGEGAPPAAVSPVATAGPGDAAGTWTGLIHRYDHSVALRLTVHPDGKVDASVDNAPSIEMTEVVFGTRYLTATAESKFHARDDYQRDAPLRFRLWRDANRITGTAMSNAAGYFGLSSYVELHRQTQ
jgi:hypothetical protein